MVAKVYFDHIDIPRPSFLGDGIWKLENLHPIIVLFGKNGSGTRLLMRVWRDAHVITSHYVVTERTGTLEYNVNMIERQLDAHRRKDQSSQNFVLDYRQQVISRIQTYFIARGASRTEQLVGKPSDLEQ